MTVDEQNLRFEFSAPWRVEKYDESCQHTERLQPYLDSEAVDFVGIHPNVVLFMEVKDFRGYRMENREKFGGPLATTIARKMRDTVAGIMGLVRTGTHEQPWRDLARRLALREPYILAVLFLEQDQTCAIDRRKALMSVEIKLLKQRMKWFGVKVTVVDLDTYDRVVPNLRVSNLKGAAGHGGAAARRGS